MKIMKNALQLSKSEYPLNKMQVQSLTDFENQL